MILTMKDLPEQFRMDVKMQGNEVSVPLHLIESASLISFRWNINGICDGMYIANVIAHARDEGDGESHFTFEGPSEFVKDNNGEMVDSAEKAAQHLIQAYGCNIPKEDRPELIRIIKERNLDLEQSMHGMQSLKSFYSAMIETDDTYRRDYHKKCMQQIEDSILFLKSRKV